ncbi:hypothetical protein KY317_03130 [Candidatus Woesearchaeota archaeon]|nr:hypothetical protein [Candidatus Woesearchaeota archaeon]
MTQNIIKTYPNIEKLADEYRANHPSHESHFPAGAELSRIVDETVERLRKGGDSTVKPSEPRTDSHPNVKSKTEITDYGFAACGYGLF